VLVESILRIAERYDQLHGSVVEAVLAQLPAARRQLLRQRMEREANAR